MHTVNKLLHLSNASSGSLSNLVFSSLAEVEQLEVGSAEPACSTRVSSTSTQSTDGELAVGNDHPLLSGQRGPSTHLAFIPQTVGKRVRDSALQRALSEGVLVGSHTALSDQVGSNLVESVGQASDILCDAHGVEVVVPCIPAGTALTPVQTLVATALAHVPTFAGAVERSATYGVRILLVELVGEGVSAVGIQRGLTLRTYEPRVLDVERVVGGIVACSHLACIVLLNSLVHALDGSCDSVSTTLVEHSRILVDSIAQSLLAGIVGAVDQRLSLGNEFVERNNILLNLLILSNSGLDSLQSSLQLFHVLIDHTVKFVLHVLHLTIQTLIVGHLALQSLKLVHQVVAV